MFSQKIFDKINEAIECEIEQAKSEHGERYHSDHEAYAVLLEEMEEARTSFLNSVKLLANVWLQLKKDEDLGEPKTQLMMAIIDSMAELAQCAAVVRKWGGLEGIKEVNI